MQHVEICASGMVTAVGMTSPATCAAIRAGISRVQETRFAIDEVPLFGAQVRAEGEDLLEKLLFMLNLAVGECLDTIEHRDDVPLILCLPEPNRPGVPEGLDPRILATIRHRLGLGAPANARGIISLGRVGGVQGIVEAQELIAAGHDICVVAGVDSFLTPATLTAYHQLSRLKTDDQQDGFVPGEAASAIVVRKPTNEPGALRCLGNGYGSEPAPLGSEEPLRADGLFQAIKSAFKNGGCTYKDVDYRIADVTGEHYGFKEAALALTRTLRDRRERFEMWRPVGSVGEVGAATVPMVLGVALEASRRGYAPGPGVLCHFSGDGSERAATILKAT